jgi:hypothetical protein
MTAGVGVRNRDGEVFECHGDWAELEAEGIIDSARAREREIRLGAEDYADEILNSLEVNLSRFIAAIRCGRERLQGADGPADVGWYR